MMTARAWGLAEVSATIFVMHEIGGDRLWGVLSS
jgi:hypothetical protein